MKEELIIKIFELLLQRFGEQHWWPAETPEEVIIGALLTQNTSWKNVEKAISNLRLKNLLNFQNIYQTPLEILKNFIKPAGFYNQKSKCLKNFATFLLPFHFSLEKVKEELKNIEDLRNSLLNIPCIGKETADSIILYAFEYPIFPVDAYSIRIFSRATSIAYKKERDYETIRNIVEKALKKDVWMLKEFHALLVELGKKYCRKKLPYCSDCPISKICKYSESLKG